MISVQYIPYISVDYSRYYYRIYCSTYRIILVAYNDSINPHFLVCKFIISLFRYMLNRLTSNLHNTVRVCDARNHNNIQKLEVTLLLSQKNKRKHRVHIIDINFCRLAGKHRVHIIDINFCRLAGGNMYGPGRGRALSLIHIPESGTGDGDTAPLTAGAMAAASSEPDLRRYMDDDVEQGISLLIAGSPIDDNLVQRSSVVSSLDC
jgi:hypothetical protein